MQILEEKSYNAYTLDKFLLTFDIGIRHETYSCESYYGIIFYIENIKYDIAHNYLMGNRICITNDTPGSLQDIPFKKETFYLLPPGIKAVEI